MTYGRIQLLIWMVYFHCECPNSRSWF